MSNQKENMPSGSYQIGQIIYILSNKSTKIIPAIVSKEIVEKTLEGNQCQWTVFVGPVDGRKTIELAKVDGEVFSSMEEVEKELRTRILSFVDATVADAKTKEKIWYKEYINKFNDKGQVSEPDPAQVDLEDLIAPAGLTGVGNLSTIKPQETVVHQVEQKETPKQQKTRKPKARIIMPDGTTVPLNDE